MTENATAAQLGHAFSFIFAVAAGFLLLGVFALIVMEERPLRTTVMAVRETTEAAE
jgi:hypothetical protein